MPVNLKRDDMGDVIKDFYKSDAPQFKGKSKKKRRQMAIAAKLNAEEATDIHDSDGNLYATVIDIIKPTTMKVPEPSVRWQELTELNKKETKKLQKASILSTSDDPKDQERARVRQTEVDYKDLLDQRKKGKVGVGKSMKEEITFRKFRKTASDAMKKAVNRKKKVLTKHQYPPGASGGDAGERAAKVVRDKDHRKYVNFLPSDD